MDIIMLFASREEMLGHINTLPKPPVLLPQLLRMLEDPNSGIDKLGELVRLEQSLAARIINVANRGAENPCDTIEEAMQRIGFIAAHRLISTVLGLQTMGSPLRAYQCSAYDLWKQSLTTACAARAVAKISGEDPNCAYLLGLMHNVGMVIIDLLIQKKAPTAVLKKSFDTNEWHNAEQRMFTFDQAEVGGIMLKAWSFPPHMVEAVKHQCRPAAAGKHEKLATVLQTARWVRHQIEAHATKCGLADPHHAKILGCHRHELSVLPLQIAAEIEKIMSDLELSHPRQLAA